MNFVKDLEFILVSAFLGGFVAQLFRIPLVVGYLTTGVIFSFFFGQYIGRSEVESIAIIGVAFLMFTLGLEFSLHRLKKLGEIIVVGSLVQIILTILLGVVLFPLFGFDLYNSLFLGCVFSLSSTAVVVKILSDKGELDTLSGEITVGWLLVQDLFTLPLIILLPIISPSLSGSGGVLWGILSIGKAISLIIASLLFLIVGRRFIPLLLDKIAQTKMRELLLVAVVSLCLLFASVASYLGFSFAIGAFIAGMLIASTASNHAIFSEVRPLRDVFSIVFFISLGFILKPIFIWENIGMILIITTLILLVKFLISSFLVLYLGYHSKVAFTVGLALTSVGEFAFIIAQLGFEQQMITERTYLTILSVAMISLSVSSPLLMYAQSLYKFIQNFITRYMPFMRRYFDQFDKQVEHTELTFQNHVVVLGHGRVGKYISKVLYDSNISYVVVDYNNHILKNLRLQGVFVIYGDPSEIDVLRAANLPNARVVIIAIPDRYAQELVISNCLFLNPNIKIICRIHHEEDHIRLKSLGVESIIQPEFEAAVSITSKLLTIFNFSGHEIEAKIRLIKSAHGF